VANRHLPYEAPLAAAFKTVRAVAEGQGFKLYEAVK
jgi:16S rRNA (guanine1207-N2)-methyltransferase